MEQLDARQAAMTMLQIPIHEAEKLMKDSFIQFLYADDGPPLTRWQHLKRRAGIYRERAVDAWAVLRGRASVD